MFFSSLRFFFMISSIFLFSYFYIWVSKSIFSIIFIVFFFFLGTCMFFFLFLLFAFFVHSMHCIMSSFFFFRLGNQIKESWKNWLDISISVTKTKKLCIKNIKKIVYTKFWKKFRLVNSNIIYRILKKNGLDLDNDVNKSKQSCNQIKRYNWKNKSKRSCNKLRYQIHYEHFLRTFLVF